MIQYVLMNTDGEFAGNVTVLYQNKCL